MIVYSIYQGDAKLVSNHARNALGLTAEGVSSYKSDIKRPSKFIYIQAPNTGLAMGNKPIFYNEEDRIAYNAPKINLKPAFLLESLGANQFGWGLLEGLYEFDTTNFVNPINYGDSIYFDSTTGEITNEEKEYMLGGSYFINSEGLALIKD